MADFNYIEAVNSLVRGVSADTHIRIDLSALTDFNMFRLIVQNHCHYILVDKSLAGGLSGLLTSSFGRSGRVTCAAVIE